MTTKTRNRLLAIIIVAFPFVLFSFFLFSRVVEVPPRPPALPNPNGYDNFLRAGSEVAENTGDFDTMNVAQLRELAGKNAAALAEARAGLSNQCLVPVQYTESYASNHLNDLAGMKRLAQAFTAEGMLVEMEGRTNDAIQSFVDTIRLGGETMRGGVLIDGLVGIAIDAMGTAHLQTLVPHLNANTCRETEATLESLEASSPTWNEVIQQENDWSHATFRGWRYDLMRLESGKSASAAIASSKRKFDAREQKRQQLIIALAARAYQLEKGHPPASAADLVPDYLKAVPKDPVTGTNLIYSP